MAAWVDSIYGCWRGGDGGGMAAVTLEMWMAVSASPLLPKGERRVDRVLHAADCALSTAETAVSASSAAAVRAARVDAAGVEAMAVGWLRSLEVPMRVSVLPLLPDGETGVDSVLHAADRALSTAETAVTASSRVRRR